MKTKRSKKISIRKHLPLSVRVHYDVIRNFSPFKLFGLGIMMFIAVFGVLLATQVISPTSEASSWTEARVMEKDYDWGRTKIAGQAEEDAHRNHLDSNFKLHTQQTNIVVAGLPQNLQQVRIDVPSALRLAYNFSFINMSKTVAYSLEEVLYKTVSSPADCNNSSWGSSSELDFGGRNTASLPATTVANGSYFCLKVKLKGAIAQGPDTHSEWSFLAEKPRVGPYIGPYGWNEPIAPPSLSITRTARRFDATASVNVKSWQYVTKNSASCGESNFRRLPLRLPFIPYSTGSSYTVPTTGTTYKYVCFRARGVDSGVWGYKSISVSITTRPPVIRVAQNNRLFTASGFNVESWQYVTKNSASCGESNFTRPIPVPSAPYYSTGSSYTVPATGTTYKYVCFRARGVDSGVWGYKSMIMSVIAQSPVIRIDQRLYTFGGTNETAIKVTATSTPASLIITSWRLVAVNINGGPNSPQTDCRSMFSDGSLDSRPDILVNKDMIKQGNSGVLYLESGFAGKWICIEAAVTGAKAHRGAYVMRVLSPPTQTDPDIDIPPNPSDAIMTTAPTQSPQTTVTETEVFRPTEEWVDPVDDSLSSTTDDNSYESPAGKNDPETTTTISSLGILEDEASWSQLGGYILLAGAVLGAARILIVKKYKKVS